LQDAGKISHELMIEITDKKFDTYKKSETIKDTDFDEVALKALESANARKNKK